MPTEITVPRLGWSMEEGVFGEWLKRPGEPVHAGDMIFLLEGEKAATEIESFDSGILCVPDGGPQPGDVVRVGQVIGYLLVEGEPSPESLPRVPSTPVSSLRQKPTNDTVPQQVQPANRPASPSARRLAWELGIDLNAVPTPDPTGRVVPEDVRFAPAEQTISANRKPRAIATPRARRQASALGIDWTQIQGTGRNGRIRERDVVAHSTTRSSHAVVAPHEIAPPASGRYQPASKIRRTLAQRMLAGVHQTAPVTLTTKVEVSAMVALRTEWKRVADQQPIPTYNDILIMVVAQALVEFREINACWYREGVWQYDGIHIALGIDTEHGLVAPVIHDADRLTVTQIAERSRTLIDQARAGKLSQSQLQGGTFTITNLGMFGMDAFTPVLNLPQAAILGVGRIIREPVVRDDRIEIGDTMCLSLTFDHRVIDGAPAARWLQRLAEMLASVRALAEFEASGGESAG